MAEQGKKHVTEWVSFLTQADIPVLRLTARKLSILSADSDHLNARSGAKIIKSDPLMIVKLMRYLQHHNKRMQTHEVMEVEQILMMLGVESALEKVPAKPLVEELFEREHKAALVHLLKVIHRAHMASTYAYDWAVRLHDLHYEEVRVAALLNNIAEILMWCFSPKEMLLIKSMQNNNKTMRSHLAQEKVLGFPLHQLQIELVTQWKLPELLVKLTDVHCAKQQRVENVILAVNLARHAANGWNDAALPDDYKAIGELLHLQPEEVKTIVGAEK